MCAVARVDESAREKKNPVLATERSDLTLEDPNIETHITQQEEMEIRCAAHTHTHRLAHIHTRARTENKRRCGVTTCPLSLRANVFLSHAASQLFSLEGVTCEQNTQAGRHNTRIHTHTHTAFSHHTNTTPHTHTSPHLRKTRLKQARTREFCAIAKEG